MPPSSPRTTTRRRRRLGAPVLVAAGAVALLGGACTPSEYQVETTAARIAASYHGSPGATATCGSATATDRPGQPRLYQARCTTDNGRVYQVSASYPSTTTAVAYATTAGEDIIKVTYRKVGSSWESYGSCRFEPNAIC